jgi:thioredoxin reductase (NADPH)
MTPVAFLQTGGVQLDSKGQPVTTTEYESSVPRLYVIGDLLGHGRGGSIIAGFNSASRAIKHVLGHHLGLPLPPEIVSLDHLLY